MLNLLKLLVAFLIIGPWLGLIVYDVLLYIWRAATYEVPFVGGRARGRQRPRAPSLTERPSGHKRRISLAAGITQRPSTIGERACTSTVTDNQISTSDPTPSKMEE